MPDISGYVVLTLEAPMNGDPFIGAFMRLGDSSLSFKRGNNSPKPNNDQPIVQFLV